MHILKEIGEVVIPGLLIVFLALIILICVVTLMGRFLSASSKKKADKKTPQAPVNAAPAQTSARASAVQSAAPNVAAGIRGKRWRRFLPQ